MIYNFVDKAAANYSECQSNSAKLGSVVYVRGGSEVNTCNSEALIDRISGYK